MSETNKMKIAVGNSRLIKKWANKILTFDDICKRLTTPIQYHGVGGRICQDAQGAAG
ncbi:MAG: hypothetical protein LUF25_00955 [Phascolarctobacterium sp.]|nr:hypothetical protein [Phascolarctobacterium sp.]MCD8174535.1 hypothetical protein [Phascolarctobacterium sp.]